VYDRSSVWTVVVAWATCKWYGIICCTEPGLKKALHILYVHVWYVYNTKNVNIYFTLTNDYRLRLTNDRPDLPSERAPKKRQDRKLQTSNF
jgi:hypothetical protein